MPVLLDSTIVIDLLRKLPSATTYFEALDTQPSISVISISEILAGVRRRQEESDAAIFWSLVKPRRVSEEIAQRAGVFLRLYHASHAVELGDALIAATAEHHGLDLATLNVKHFPMFKGLKAAY